MLNDLFGFRGRIGRLKFFGLWMLQGVVVLVAIVVAVVIGAPMLKDRNLLGLLPLLGAFVIGFWIWLAISSKRMADIGIPRGLRRYVYLAWFFISGLIGAALGARYIGINILLGQAPLLMLLFWPGQRSAGDGPPGYLAHGITPAPARSNWADQIDFAKADGPFPVAANPQPAASVRPGPAPLRPTYAGVPNGPRTTFGRRGF